MGGEKSGSLFPVCYAFPRILLSNNYVQKIKSTHGNWEADPPSSLLALHRGRYLTPDHPAHASDSPTTSQMWMVTDVQKTQTRRLLGLSAPSLRALALWL